MSTHHSPHSSHSAMNWSGLYGISHAQCTGTRSGEYSPLAGCTPAHTSSAKRNGLGQRSRALDRRRHGAGESSHVVGEAHVEIFRLHPVQLHKVMHGVHLTLACSPHTPNSARLVGQWTAASVIGQPLGDAGDGVRG
jgi:hypothetical protein